MSESSSPRSSALLIAESSDELPLPVINQRTELEEWGVAREVNESLARRQLDPLSTILSSAWARAVSRVPRLALALELAREFVRGPTPPVVLQGPYPLIQFVQNSPSGRSISYETIFIRRTRFLSSPVLFAILVPLYVLVISALTHAQSYSIPPEQSVGCTTTFWPAPYDRCGLNGEDCPLLNTSFGFKCPSECAKVYLHNPRIVGANEITYEPLVVGGGDSNWTYRGDSWICAAALHAGMISEQWGGCVDVRLTGAFTNFLPRTSQDLTSIGFPSSFPLAFRLSPNTSLSYCTDLRTHVLVFNAVVTFLLFAVLRPGPPALYWSLICIGFWHVTLFSQTRATPPDLEGGFATFLPTLFVAHAFWQCAVRWTLPPLTKRIPLEGAILYLGPWWITVLNNMTLDRLPVDRLMLGDITKRAGGLATLFVGAAIVIAVLANQLRLMRATGYLPAYLRRYATGLGIVIALALLPGLNLRIHHYIFAIMFIPGTAFPTRLSAVFQGFLLGMFLNGVAAWGFDGILQTAQSLRRDAPSGTEPPTFLPFDALNGLVRWAALPENGEWDGFRLLIDDVLRYTGPALNYSVQTLQDGVPHFFRVAFTRNGERAGDWTMPATLWPNRTWAEPVPGTSY